jgi:predicted phage tail protein
MSDTDLPEQIIIRGAGGGKGGGGSAPSESPNTLQSKAIARIVDLISEGEIVGLYTGEGDDGKAFPLKAVYFDNVQVQGPDGGYKDDTLSEPELSAPENLTDLRFEGVQMWERTGLPTQDVIEEFSEVESEITVNQEVTDPSPVLFVVSDDDIDGIRLKIRIPALYLQNSKGSLVPSKVEYKVEMQESGGAFLEIIRDEVTGKNTSPYERSSEIVFSGLTGQYPDSSEVLQSFGSPLTFPLTFQVTRVTPDSDKATLQNNIFVNSYTEIQKVQLTYPDSALIAIRVNSELFSGRVPQRSFLVRGLKISVPTNYFPETRLYNRNVSTGAAVLDGDGLPETQTWDGNFYTAWSNNPAWVLYDVLTNSRYGLGEFIDAATQVDIFSLYDIGVYCDEKVDNGLGNGNNEPRYEFNGVINTREDAFDVVNAITSTFRGMSYWSAGGVTAVADAPKDPKRLITRSNVVKGHFTYAGTALRAQHSAALVSYNDPINNYKQSIEVIEDPARRERFGWREIEVAAFATTSRGQAYRLGKWILDSEKNESETLSFVGSVELSDLRPGDIIQVADPARQQVRRGGRIISHTAGSPDVIQVDSPIETFAGDTLLVTNKLGAIESLAVEQSNGASASVNLKSVSAVVNFVDSGPDTVVRTDGGSWVDDGFLNGQSIRISDASESANNDKFSVAAVSETTLTLADSESLTADTGDTVTVGHAPSQPLRANSVFVHRGTKLVPEEWRVLSMRETEELQWEFSCLTYDRTKFARIEGVRSTAGVNFVDSNPDTIVRMDGGDWTADGLTDGQKITVSDANIEANNGIYTVDTVTSTTLTLSEDDSVTADTNDLINIGTPSVILDAPPTSFLPSGPVAPATNLTIFETIEKVGGAVQVKLDISWTRSTDPRVQLYRLETRNRKTTNDVTDPPGEWTFLPETPNVHAEIANAADGYWSFRVTALISQSDYSQSSSVLEVTDQLVIGKTAPPPDVTNLTATRGYTEVVLDWDDVDDIDLTGYVVSRGSSAEGAEVLVDPVYASSYTAIARTHEDQTYHVRAKDTMSPANLSTGVASVDTSIQALPAVTNFRAYQVDDGVRLTWDAVSIPETVQYEIKEGADWANGSFLANATDTYFSAPFPVNTTRSVTFRIKPLLRFSADSVSYGPETTVTVSLIPFVNGFLLKSTTEEPTWSSLGPGVASRWDQSGPDPSDTYTAPSVIKALSKWPGSGNRIDAVRNGAWRTTLNVTAGTPTGNVLKVGGISGEGAMGLGFDSSGNLIWRVGQGRTGQGGDKAAGTYWNHWPQTSWIHHWPLRESSGNRADQIGSNTLTETGTVGEGARTYGAKTTAGVTTSFFESSTPSYLTGTDISIAGKDWSLVFWFNPDSSSDWTGSLFELGSGNTLDVELISSTQMRVTYTDSVTTGSAQVTKSVAMSQDSWQMGFVLYDDTANELTVGLGRGDTQVASTVGSLVDGTGDLRIGKDFDGSMDQVLWFERLLDISSGQELEQFENDFVSSTIGNMRIEVPNASIPASGDFEVTFDIDKGDWRLTDGSAPAHGRLWINDTLYEADEESGLGYESLRATVVGKFAGATGSWPGEDSVTFNTPTNITFVSDLDYWYDQTVRDTLEVVSNALTLYEGSTYAVYDFPFNLTDKRVGRLWHQMTASAITADPLNIFDATMLIDSLANTRITSSVADSEIPVLLWIDVENTGTFVPFEPGTYEFKDATIRAVLERGENETTRPSIDNLSVYFREQPPDLTLKASTSDATPTALTTDGAAAGSENIIAIPDNFSATIKGTCLSRKTDNSQRAVFGFEATLSRSTGAATTVLNSASYTIPHRDDEDWDLEVSADTTNGGLSVVFTGKAGTNISSICDIDISKDG